MSQPGEEERLRALLEHILDAIVLIEPDGTVSYVSSQIVNVLGYTPSEFVAMGAFEAVFPEDREAARAQFELLMQQPGGSRTSLNRVRHKNGSWRWIETVSTNQLENPNIRAIAATLRDITDRRRIEEALHEREEHLRLIVESATDFAIFTLNLEGRITSWNVGAERILGYRADEVLGEHFRFIFTPEDNAEGRAEVEMRRALKKGQEPDDRWHMKNGATRFWASGMMMPLTDQAGEIKGFLKILRDRTEQKRDRDALQEADRRKGEFLAMLGHELRNPLGAIHNAVQLLLQSNDSEDISWVKDVTSRQVKQLTRVVDDLLDVASINHGRVRLRVEPTDLAAVIAHAVQSVAPLFDAKKQHLTVSVAPPHVILSVDAARMEQVLVNLLTNAAQYTAEDGHISLTAHQNGAVTVSVKDDGVGIPRELLSQIFDLFFQGDRPLHRPQGGLGVGLTLVKRLVEMHGGTVSASSEGAGKGSEFTVQLPSALDPAERSLPPRPESPVRPREAIRVLVVDDNPDAVIGMAKLLLASGFRVTTAADGPTALHVARAEQPDAILMDIGLPGLDGYRVARELRKEKGCENAVLIAVTGYGQEEDRHHSREVGFNHHLVKPVDFPTLFSLLSRAPGRPTD
jgi:PAS domain S-box-containing protein